MHHVVLHMWVQPLKHSIAELSYMQEDLSGKIHICQVRSSDQLETIAIMYAKLISQLMILLSLTDRTHIISLDCLKVYIFIKTNLS